MDTESIAQMAEKLDAWWNDFSSLLISDDRAMQTKALVRGAGIVKELDRLKADGAAAITSILNRPQPGAESECVASLLRAFIFSARLANTLHDELLDTDGENEIWRLMDKIVQGLDKTSHGRAGLDVLIGHPVPRVRGAAGAYLIDLLPDRVIPMLREVEDNEDANSSHFNAYWTLLAWEREHKSRFNYLTRQSAGATVR
jgi:hypothetical protein